MRWRLSTIWVQVQGEGDRARIVVEATDATAVTVTADRAVVRNLTVRAVGSGATSGAVWVKLGRVVIEGCDLTSAIGAVVYITGEDSAPVIRDCQIRHGKGSGVRVSDRGKGTIEKCVISGNALAGVETWTGGNPTVRYCQIRDNKRFGVYVHDQGQGTFTGNTLAGNARGAWDIAATAGRVTRTDIKQGGVLRILVAVLSAVTLLFYGKDVIPSLPSSLTFWVPSTPTSTPPTPTFTALVAGWRHTCGLVSGGTAYCWGQNWYGQLGDGTSGNGKNSADRTSPVAVNGGLTYTALVAGEGHTCGLVSGGTAYCWGANGYRQLGDGTSGNGTNSADRTSPVAVNVARTFTAQVARGQHTCGLAPGGTAYCWGWNVYSQLGDGTSGNGPIATVRTAPVAVSGGWTFTALVAGGNHTCGLVSGGTAYCWGYNASGQLGDGTSGTNRTAPVAVSGGLTFTALVAGDKHTCGLVSGGTAYCWGYNDEGQLGDGTSGNGTNSANRTVPVAVSGGLTFTALMAGAYHTCGLVSGGTAYCWGYNGKGQLGDGTSGNGGNSANRTTPVAVSGGRTFTALVAGGSHTCGLVSGGTAYCWGENGYGQLGDGTKDDRITPVAVSRRV